jgi:hypothetical protein
MTDVIDDRIFTRARPGADDGSAIYCTGEESLRVSSFNSAAGVELQLEARFLAANGVFQPTIHRHVPLTTRALQTTILALGDGWLSNLQVRATAGTPQRGQCYVHVELIRGNAGAVQPLGTLLAEYVTDVQRVAWPGSLLRSSVEGRGFMRSFAGTDPGAGVEISEVVPAGARWRPVSASFVLVTSAVVANRFPIVTLDDGVNTYAASSVAAAITASTTARISAGAYGTANSATPLGNVLPLPPDVLMPAGHRIRTATTGLDVGDNYGPPQLLVEEWIAG